MKSFLFLFILILYFPVFGNDKISVEEQFLKELKYDSVVYLYSKQIDLLDNNDLRYADILLKRSRAFELWFKYEAALRDYLKALQLYEKKKNYNGLVITYTRLAELARKTQNFVKANYYLKQGEKYLEKEDITNVTLAKYFNRKAAILSETGGDINRVIFYSSKVIKLAKSIKNKNLEATSLNEIGFGYEKRGDAKCVKFYENAYELFIETNDIQNALNVLINLSRYNVATENYIKSLSYTEQGFNLIGNEDIPEISIKFYYFQYLSLVHLSRYKEANLALQNYSDSHVKNVELEWNRSLKEIETKYELQLKKDEFEKEKNKSYRFELEAKNKSTQRNFILLIVILLAVLLFVIFKLNKSLKLSLKQKEILLQEVHHRVKNNLTLLNSLLFLRGEASDDKKVIDVLNECQARVQTMSIVHQNLYDVEDASKVDFNQFLHELIVESISLMDYQNKKINSNIETNKIFLEMGSAVFLGLILNELITNSLKYAFQEEKTHEIFISLKCIKSKYTLMYSDSGNGLPKSFNLKESTGFGFKLINIMIDQIDGKLDYKQDQNLYIVQFKL